MEKKKQLDSPFIIKLTQKNLMFQLTYVITHKVTMIKIIQLKID